VKQTGTGGVLHVNIVSTTFLPFRALHAKTRCCNLPLLQERSTVSFFSLIRSLPHSTKILSKRMHPIKRYHHSLKTMYFCMQSIDSLKVMLIGNSQLIQLKQWSQQICRRIHRPSSLTFAKHHENNEMVLRMPSSVEEATGVLQATDQLYQTCQCRKVRQQAVICAGTVSETP
jgi:hypothetical protein